ncbi:MAG: SpaH/EbpB family LPXTG-anchored major pilin [Eubacteriales bacterium]|nr:SpaH/EbpB family LPXTG-anchored major pilin [Eubacteriales bacterium]
MKRTKKLVSLLLTLIMVLAMGTSAFAAGETGSITIKDSSTVSVAGKTFNAYKILDVKLVGDGYVYTVPADMKGFYANRYGLTGNEGDFDAQVATKINEEEDLFAFAAAALAAAKNAGITPSTANADAGAESVTISGLPLGYYVVEDAGAATPISALILDTTNPDVAIEIKADKPGVDKKIDGDKDTDEGTTGDVQYNNAAVGDKVPYKVTSKVPDMTGYTKYYFVVNDTLSKGLTFNDDAAITVGEKTLVKDTDYTVTSTENADGTTSVEIVFTDFIQYKDQTNDAITITYSATVNENAVIGTEGNPNKVTLTYSNNPNVKDNGDPENPDKPKPDSPVGETPESETRTYVTDVELIKVDPQGNRLTGAEFKLEGTKLNTVLVRSDVYTEDADGAYWKLKDGSYTTDDPNTEGMDQTKYESTTTKYTKSVETTTIEKAENVTYTGTVGADGVLRFEGLAAGTYTITEIKAPDGYNLLKDPITVTIGFTAPASGSTECTWTYTGTDVVNGTNTNHVTITNKAGSELPSTGGMGTTLFYVIGGILVIGAAVLLITKKRMSAEK